ncbi:mitochondrial carrier (BOU / S-adenosylmethionine carrier) [Gracilaria domingensis]|nr:mitochondrial carrier (BOU / S-adenosylmethionine carrier) [Gracilaria domingensis]
MVSTSRTASLKTALTDIITRDGVQGLYRGFGISVIMQAPAVATYLTTYDYAKQYTAKASGISDTSPLIHLASGLIAETVSAVFWVPMEVIKQRAQVRTGALAAAHTSVIAKDLIAHEGPRALFKGYGLTVGVFGPYSMIYFMAYENFKNLGGDSSTALTAASAAGAGAIAAACTTPLDVIKTRIQTQGDVTRGTSRYTGTWDAMKSIAREEGMYSFFRGTSARVLWIMPGTAITMSCFEFLKSYFRLAADR